MDTGLHVRRHHKQFNQLSSESRTKMGLICNISQCSGEVVERLARTYDGRNEMQVDERNEDWQAQLTVMLVTDERQVKTSQADEAVTIRTTAFRDPANQSCQNITLLNETLSVSVSSEKLITYLWHGKKTKNGKVQSMEVRSWKQVQVFLEDKKLIITPQCLVPSIRKLRWWGHHPGEKVWYFVAFSHGIWMWQTNKTRNVGQCPTWWPPCRI